MSTTSSSQPSSSPTTAASTSPRTPAIRALAVLALGLLAVLGLALPAQADAAAAGATPPGKAWVRAGHFVPGFGAAQVDLRPKVGTGASIVMSPSATYGDVTSYQKVDPGEYTVDIRPKGAPSTSAPMLSRSVTVTSGKAWTIAVIGTDAAPRLAILNDDLSTPAAGTARVRLLSASALAPTVTVMAVGGPTIASGTVLGQTTGYTTVPQGPWTLNLTGASMATSQTVNLAGGSVYTAVALDSGTTDVRLEVITDAAGAMATPVGAAATGFGGAASAATADDATNGLPLVAGAAAALLLAVVVVSRRVTARRPVLATVAATDSQR